MENGGKWEVMDHVRGKKGSNELLKNCLKIIQLEVSMAEI